MKKHKFSIQRLLVKISILTISIYVILFLSAAIIANIVFFNLNNYKNNISNLFTQKTGYKLHIKNIQTRFTYDYLPEIILNEISISGKNNPSKKLSFKHVIVNLSYASLWKLNLIFNKILINGTQLDLEYSKEGDLTLNGIIISKHNAKQQAIQKSSFDVEDWVLKQHSISLNNINLSVWDKKNNFKKIALRNINIVYLNKLFNSHNLTVTINEATNKNNLFADLSWNGGKLENYNQWHFGEFTLKSYNDNPIFSKRIQPYVPDFGIINRYKAKTAISISIKDGLLTSMDANFNLTNLSYTLANSSNIINFPNIGGTVNIQLNKKTRTYNINAESLQISTNQGIILDNKRITGSYTLDESGSIYVYNSNLNGINNLLSIIPRTKNISVVGKINHMRVIWHGNIFKPTSYNYTLDFHDIGIKDNKQTIPQIDHVSGSANIAKENGSITINLESSTFSYKKLFYVPFKINKLTSNISWQHTNKNVVITLKPTIIKASDFNVLAHGKYIYNPNDSGFIELYAQLDKIPANRVGYYLPNSIDSANQWLQKSLLSGYGESASLILQGKLEEFPFESGHGKFYIDANINNGRLLYIKNWPTIDNVYGKFMIRNQKIIITANKAKINNNNLTKALVTIPNMLEQYSYLIADGEGIGSTQNFLNYLSKTPVNKMIGRLPSKAKTKGNGKVAIHLKVPFSYPDKTDIQGSYSFINNQIALLDMPVPIINNTNGKLTFTNKGINISSLQANILGGRASLAAKTNSKGVIYFTSRTESLDYKQLASLYLPWAVPLLQGSATTNIDFTVTGQGIKNISANSSLYNVKILAAEPLHKDAGESKSLNFNLNNLTNNNTYAIQFNYGNILFGKTVINSKNKLTSAQINVNTNESSDSNLPSIITINAYPERFDLIDWLSTINKISSDSNKQHHKLATRTSQQNKNDINSSSDLTDLPTSIVLRTKGFYIDQMAFGKAHAEAYIGHKIAAFNMTSDALDGYGVYQIPTNRLYVTFYFVNLNNEHKSVEKHESYSYSNESYNIAKINESNFEQIFESMQRQAQEYAASISQALQIPTTELQIKQLYYKGNDLGNLALKIIPEKGNLTIESGKWISRYSTLAFNATNYCFACNKNKALVDANFNMDISDLGKLLDTLRYDGILAQTSGNIQGRIQWHGTLDDFRLNNIATKIDIKLGNGRFLKVDTGSLLGSIIGIINLQTVANLVSLNFRDIFANGFAFNDLEAKTYIINNIIHIKYFYMSSTLAVVGLKGIIDLQTNTINMYLNVTPSLGIGVAVGAGIILTPIIGVATYLAEMALQNPVNKLFAFTFHLTGQLKNPTITQIGVSKQITKNIGSTVGQ